MLITPITTDIVAITIDTVSTLTIRARDDLSRKRFYAIPMELVIEAQKWAVSIDDTCIQALRRKIQEKKELLYVASFLKTRALMEAKD